MGIENGEKARIWGKKWVPSLTIYSPPHQDNVEAKVSELIDKNIGGWDLNIIANLFQDDEALAVTSIPLSRTDQEDRLI